MFRRCVPRTLPGLTLQRIRSRIQGTMELRLTLPEALLLAAFALCSLAVFALVGWLASRRLHQRALYRGALKAARRADHAAAFRLLAAAERCWLPATLHPTAGNCQRSLEEYARIVSHLAAEAAQLGTAADGAGSDLVFRFTAREVSDRPCSWPERGGLGLPAGSTT